MSIDFVNFYTEEKKTFEEILNESFENKVCFMIGFDAADGNRKKNVSSTQKHKITLSGLNHFCQSLGLKTCIGIRDDKFIAFLSNTVITTSIEKIHNQKFR